MRRVLYLMGALDDPDVDWLATNGTVHFVRSGQLVMEQGLPVAYLQILLDGSLSVFQKTSPDRLIKQLFAGEVIGEISFVDARPSTASVRACVDSRLLVIDRGVLLQKLERDQGFSARFYRALALFLADRLRSTMGNLGFGEVQDNSEDSIELDEALLDNVALGATRFHRFLKQLRVAS